MKRIFYLFFFLIISGAALNAQIDATEGLNMPGSWNSWHNPPDSAFLKQIPSFTIGETHIYRTVFNTLSTNGNIAAGDYAFLFTSGPSDNIWQNKWTDVAVSFNTIQTYTWHGDGGGNDNTITLNADKWYVVNWEDKGYTSTNAIFMELSAEPVQISSVSRDIASPTETDDVTITVTLDKAPCAEEHIYLRYTTDDWQTYTVNELDFAGGTSASAVIPAQGPGVTVKYYVFSTTIANPASAFGLITINFNDNNGAYYSYTTPGTAPLTCELWQTHVVSTDPVLPTDNDAVVLYYNAALGNGALEGYSGDVYAHIGVITNLSTSPTDWRYVKTDWGENTAETKFERIGTDLYKLTIFNVRAYFGVPSSETIEKIALVARSGETVNGDYIVGRDVDGSDMYTPVYTGDLTVKVVNPSKDNMLLASGDSVNICAYSLAASSIKLMVDGTELASDTDNDVIVKIYADDYTQGLHTIIAEATDGTNTVRDTGYFYVVGQPVVEDLPAGLHKGVNYIDDNTVTFVLWDPAGLKKYAFVLGDFNDWQVNDQAFMKKTSDGKYFWITISGLEAGKPYTYQYYIDGNLKIADPYAELILDPWNDKYIPSYNFPNIPAYPEGKTTGIVSVLQTAQTPYQWQVTDFVPTAVNSTQPRLLVYEMWIHDFVESSAIKDVQAKLDYLKSLGVNAIEIMPFNEFEGNISWGYNPDFYFAPDKAYGTPEDYKAFIDACHQAGIAVIMDVVFNHSFGQCPLVQMYWDSQTNNVSAENPWYNQVCPHPFGVGYDFDHESSATKEFVKDVLKYWLTEYKIDGFRFDLSKGFTNKYTGSDVGAWSAYDQSRVDILTDYYNFIKSVNPNAYVILEHLGDNSEETVLANTGMILWSNMNYNYGQASMGWSGSDLSWAYYGNRGFDYPNNLVYAESHDEERIMYKNLQWGNSYGDYSVKDKATALRRAAEIAPFLLGIPGPKMIWQFGELGYDYSINYCAYNNTVSEDCRTSPKPIRWDYNEDPARRYIYKVYQLMAQMRANEDAFLNGTYDADVSGLVKRIWLSSNDFNMVIAGNFDVKEQSVAPDFQHTGTWYDLLTGETLDISDASVSYNYAPGEFHIYTDKYYEFTATDESMKTGQISVYPNPADSYVDVYTDAPGQLSIYSVAGQLVKSQSVNGKATINVSALSPGIYLFKFNADGKTAVKKVVIK